MFHLAEVNIAWMRGPTTDPVMTGLASRIDEIYRLADESTGFVWRLPCAETTPEALEVFRADFPGFHSERFFYNMSVWVNLEALRAYTFQTAHAELLNDRKQWIDHMEGASMALWWIPAGHIPTITESAERLRAVERSGPTPHAFTIRNAFPPPEKQARDL